MELVVIDGALTDAQRVAVFPAILVDDAGNPILDDSGAFILVK